MSSLEQNFSSSNNSFSASHFLVGFGSCGRLHGHNYHVVINIQYSKLDSKSTLDFQVVNSQIQKELESFNKKILIPAVSSEIRLISDLDNKNWKVQLKDKHYSFPKIDVKILNGIDRISCENLAFYIHQQIKIWLRKDYSNLISSLRVKISENFGNQAIYSARI